MRSAKRQAAVTALVALILLAVTDSARPRSSSPPPILLFNRAGAPGNDVAAIDTILQHNQLDYATVNSAQLNAMGQSDLMAYRLLIVTGGNFIVISDSLTSSAMANIHTAVQGGLNYLAICAGGFLAGQGTYHSMNLTSGVQFHFYGDESRGIRKAAVAVTAVGSPTLEQYWEDGPQFTGWGAVVGKYPDGTAAILEGAAGQGWVILSGVHPEAPASWRGGMTFTTPASVDHAYVAMLIDAALHGTRLAHF